MEEFKIIAIIVISILLILFFIAGLAYLYTVNIGEANKIAVFNEDMLIYEGKRAFININSGGMTTTITIYKQLFPFYITDKTISSANIRIEDR